MLARYQRQAGDLAAARRSLERVTKLTDTFKFRTSGISTPEKVNDNSYSLCEMLARIAEERIELGRSRQKPAHWLGEPLVAIRAVSKARTSASSLSTFMCRRPFVQGERHGRRHGTRSHRRTPDRRRAARVTGRNVEG